MSGKSASDFTQRSSASSYSGTCHLPTPASPISRMKASAAAISSASCAVHEPPARRLEGAKKTLNPGPYFAHADLEPLGQLLIGRVIAEEPAPHTSAPLEGTTI